MSKDLGRRTGVMPLDSDLLILVPSVVLTRLLPISGTSSAVKSTTWEAPASEDVTGWSHTEEETELALLIIDSAASVRKDVSLRSSCNDVVYCLCIMISASQKSSKALSALSKASNSS
eukprot:CAMPEP_0185044316 /NCGR_PEP_ID=MMETSP1103-20130426/43382_1 /TAXON_ID=36769 /ORGANISM="Paraphysomonas bandaiensis, Strain Caron Lab Isolate" /LENGTH=117 /DNA_ID=CAMNT_0027584569 /DNA_START=348 /DNA_END=701 /DNA_ORIENTATION=+